MKDAAMLEGILTTNHNGAGEGLGVIGGPVALGNNNGFPGAGSMPSNIAI